MESRSRRAGYRPSLQQLILAGRNRRLEEGGLPPIPDIYGNAASSKLELKLKPGLVMDDKFRIHECLWDSLYPECPGRSQCVDDRIRKYRLQTRCTKIEAQMAHRDDILLCHDEAQLDLLESTRDMNNSELEELAGLYDSVYFCLGTYTQAMLAAGSAIALVKAIMKNTVQGGMAVIRPPGHHAGSEVFSGYCFFNNVAIAAKYALEHDLAKKILIVDWDVHHGNATQDTFYDDPRVLYFSIHRYEYGTFWPNLRKSNFNYIGGPTAKGKNINIPLNQTRCTDVDYIAIFHSILLPVAYEFQPELVLISAGYDAALGCPEGEMLVTPGCYHHLTTMLLGLAEGRVAVILEGGYFQPSLAEAGAQTLRALLGDPAPHLELNSLPHKSVMSSVYDSLSLLRDYWKCLSFTHDNHIGEPDNRYKHKPVVRYEGQEPQGPYQTRYCYPLNTTRLEKQLQEEITRLQRNYYDQKPMVCVGYTYDHLMTQHKSPAVNSFERPERITKAIEVLSDMDLLNRIFMQVPRCADIMDISKCHTLNYINKIHNMPPLSEQEVLNQEGWNTVFCNPFTMTSASVAVGGLMELVTAVIHGRCSSAVGIIRPPGHHAEAQNAAGYCIFNNVAIAAKFALNEGLQRVLIVDFDIHHGNGIQNMFYENPKVLYISLHRYDNGQFYPGRVDGDCTLIGRGQGTGYNINIPFNSAPMGDTEYLAAFFRLVLPISYQYNPELVIVAAGFDACIGDPIGGYHLSPEVYGHFIQLLKPLASGRIILALEGGYNVNSVGYSIAMCVKALLGDPLPPLKPCGQAHPLAIATINECIEVLHSRWFILIKDVQFIFDDRVKLNEFVIDSSDSSSYVDPEAGPSS